MMTTILSGFSIGAMYAIIGIAQTIPMVRGAGLNFTLPVYIILGEYIVVDLTGRGWTVIELLLLLVALGAVIGGLQERFLKRRTRGGDTAMVGDIGVFIGTQGFILAYW